LNTGEAMTHVPPSSRSRPSGPQGPSGSPEVLVIGLGYVGLPLAVEASRAGLTVTGFDTNRAVIEGLNSARSHIPDVADDEIEAMLEDGFQATGDEAMIGSPETVVICVPTPLTDDKGPDLSSVISASILTSRLLRPGLLVVLESTTYPGTTDEIVRPLLEERSGLRVGQDFALAFSPERIDPGNPDFGIRNTPKVVGGITPSCTEAAEIFYGKICDQVIKAASAREAEMAKLLENTYRHVNIALVNEMAIFSHELGVDLWDAIRCAATKPFGFQAFYPGPGIGGHCIPIDPNYLSHRVRTLGYPFRFVELAQEINDRMPDYVVDRAVWLLNDQKKALNGALVLLAGVTYKKDSADLRETPAVPVARKLLRGGARLAYADPYVHEWQVDEHPIENTGWSADAVAAADLVILLQAHSAFDLDGLASHAQVFLDTRGASRGGHRL
jgi:UDP-N-acetyl-D-glucosamine dehydrogenase